ncbi:MAG: penicillin-binding protein 2 [Rhodocyclaceae bacterium]|nr:penicillin-binding protein 2 [Rhodocyclaceae bacterium]
MKFTHTPLLSEKLPDWRARILLLFLMLAFLALAVRSIYLQGINNDFLQQKGASRYARVLELPATRGRITDRNGEPLAVSAPVKSIWAVPEYVEVTPAQERDLAAALDMDVRELARRLAIEKDFVFLKRQIPPQLADKVATMKLPGIYQQAEYRRFYPSAEVTAHLIGFTGADGEGQEGMELAFDRQLLGKAGSRWVIKDRRGHIVEDVQSIKPPRNGNDISLAMDSKIQYLAYAQLRDCVAEHKAKGAGIVVLDVKTGEVLALVNLPTYNPNNRERLSGAQLRNRAVTDTFEPGSTMKPFTIALGLESGKYRPDTIIQTGNGHLTIGKATVHDSHPGGAMSVSQVIQKSSNVGATRIALSLPPEDMWNNFESLGFGNPPKLGFPGEATGRVRPWKYWRPIEQATMSFGHGISVSLVQLARAYEVFARDGDMLPVSLRRMEGPAPAGKQVLSPETARQVRAMLELVVQPGGTATKAAIPGYRAAGKTGTAHKLDGGHYAENRYIASFVGFAPASDPRLIVAVMVDEPSAGKYYGGDVAAPVFSRVMAGALRTLGVAPDAPIKPLQYAVKVEDVKESM